MIARMFNYIGVTLARQVGFGLLISVVTARLFLYIVSYLFCGEICNGKCAVECWNNKLSEITELLSTELKHH